MKETIRHICVCLGYESLVIPLKLINEGEKSVAIFTPRKDIVKFCKDVKIPVITIRDIAFSEAALNPRKIRRIILDSLNGIDYPNTRFHITHKNFGVHTLVMVIMAEFGNVYFHRTEIDAEKELELTFFNTFNIKSNIKHLIYYWGLYKFFYRYRYRIYITYRYILDQIIPVVKNKSFEKLKINIINYKNKHQLFIDVYSQYSIDLPNCDNLFLYPDVDEWSKIVSKESILYFINFIEDYNNVTYKIHPNRSIEVENKQYPTHIPAELLIKHTKRNVISTWSATLRYSLQVPEVKTLVCTDLLDWKEQEKKKMFTNLVNDWGCAIFPKNYNELDELIRN